MTEKCWKCSADCEPTQAQLKKGYWVCKPCRKAQNLENRAKRRAEGKSVSGTRMPSEYHREYEQTYKTIPSVKARKARNAKKYREGELRYRHEARWKVASAIQSGALIRQPCQVCGETKVDAHHEDYSKPLNVWWLCRKHHVELHKKARAAR